MKQNKFFIGLAAIAAAMFTFASCTSDETESQATQQSGNVINFTYGPATTRTATDPQSSTSVSTGLNVGIFGVSSEATTTMTNYTNNKYVTAAGNNLSLAEGSSNMTWPTTANATASLYAYAPYQENWAVNTANSFAVQPNQTTDANYLASDLLYASAADQAQSATVGLAFSHKLSKVNITIKKATGSNVTLLNATVKIKYTKLKATFNPTTGALGDVTTDNDPAEIIAATIASELEAGNESSTATACAVIVPQQLAANTAFVEITTTDSKTLIGKLSEATTFASGQSYSMTVSVGNVTEAVTEVPISLGTTSLVAWTNNNIGLTAYGVGDYVLTDGTFMKASAYASASAADKAKVAGIIFSTTVSSTDATAGYNAYAMGLERKKQSFTVNSTYPDQMCTPILGTNFEDAFADLDGRTRTSQMLTSDYYNALDESGKTAFIGNLSWYTKTVTSNASSWFLPSFGQLMQILNNLGSAGITSTSATVSSSSSEADCLNATTEETVVTSISSKITAVSGSGDMFKKGNIDFVSSSENGSANSTGHSGKIWGFKIKAANNDADWNGLSVGRHYGRGETQYSVIPCIAVTLPSVAE